MASRNPDHITLCTDVKSATGTSIKLAGSSEVDMDKYSLNITAELLVRVKKSGGGDGYVGVKANGELLGFLKFSDSAPTQKRIPLDGFPTSGQVTVDLVIKCDGIGTVYVTGASIQVS